MPILSDRSFPNCMKPCYYFIWCYLEVNDTDYVNKPKTVDYLKILICETIAEIRPEIILQLMESFSLLGKE